MIQTNILYDNAAIGHDKQILQDIHLETKNIAIYKRGVAFFNDGLSKTARMSLPYKASGTVGVIAGSLNSFFDRSAHLNKKLLKDILYLLDLFAKVTKVSSFRVSLATVHTTMCSRFHADNNQLRMLCTYYGPGTLWLPENAVDRKAYLTGRDNDKIMSDENLVQQVDTGDVIILKGALYPGATPILHRSPSIGENGSERILLCIDANQTLASSITNV